MEWLRPDSTHEGSRARDHLANERTYLAWLRTGAAATGLGVALERFGSEASTGEKVLAIGFVALGLLTIVVSAWRYIRVMQGLDHETFVPNIWGPLAVTGLGAALSVAALVVLFT